MKVTDVYTSDQQKKYIGGFATANKPSHTKRLKDSVTLVPGTPVKPKQVPIRSKPLSHKRPHLIPSDTRYSIRDKRLNAIYKELREIEIKNHRNAAAVLFRVFIELSIDLYIENHQVQVNDNDKLARKAEKAITHMKKNLWAQDQEVKGIQVAIASPNNPLSFHTFNHYVHNRHFHPDPSNLTTAWDNVQPFLNVLFGHLN